MTFCSVNLCIVSLRMQNVTLFYNRDRQRTLLLNVFFIFHVLKTFLAFLFFSLHFCIYCRLLRGGGSDGAMYQRLW